MKIIQLIMICFIIIKSHSKIESYVEKNVLNKRKLDGEDPLDMLEGVPPEEDMFGFDEENNDLAKQNAETKTFKKANNLSDYKKIMFLGTTLNYFYNYSINLIKKEQMSSQVEQTKMGVEIYENSKQFIQTALKEPEELREEINSLYENIDALEIDVVTCVKFFGFDLYYQEVMMTVNADSNEFDSKFQDLKYLVDQFRDEVVKFLGAVQSIKYLGRFLKFMAMSKKHTLSLNNIDTVEKVNIGADLAKEVLKMRKKLTGKFMNMQEAINFVQIFRLNLYNGIKDMTDAGKNKTNEVDQSELQNLSFKMQNEEVNALKESSFYLKKISFLLSILFLINQQIIIKNSLFINKLFCQMQINIIINNEMFKFIKCKMSIFIFITIIKNLIEFSIIIINIQTTKKITYIKKTQFITFFWSIFSRIFIKFFKNFFYKFLSSSFFILFNHIYRHFLIQKLKIKNITNFQFIQYRFTKLIQFIFFNFHFYQKFFKIIELNNTTLFILNKSKIHSSYLQNIIM